MKIEVRIADAARTVEIEREASGRLRVRLDGAPVEVDAVEVGGNAYSILLEGSAFEVQVLSAEQGLTVRCGGHEFPAEVRDPRAWRGRRHAVQEVQGRQQVASPMPGKVV